MSHVKQYTRVSHGKMQTVHAYDDKRSRSGKKVSHHVVTIDKGMEKIRETVTELLRTDEGVKELEAKIKSGGFLKSLPEVVALYGVEQGVHHPYRDTFDHTIQVIKHLPADASDNVRWAALLHDIGKATTQQVHPDRGIVFDGHEYAGYKMVGKVLDRLGFSKDDQAEIKHLVLHHGNLRTKFLRSDENEAREFMAHKHFEPLLTLHQADVKASGRDPKEVLDAIDELKTNTPASRLEQLSIRPSTGEPGPKIYLPKVFEFDDSILQKFPHSVWKDLQFDEKKTIELDRLVITQEQVDKKAVAEIMDNFDPSKASINAIYDGQTYHVVDGHHTLLAAKLLGYKQMGINFVNKSK